MSKKSKRVSKKPEKGRKKEANEWPAVVYFWSFGLAILSYAVIEIGWHTTLPHPFHWLAALIGGIVGVGVGWLWYRARGDVF